VKYFWLKPAGVFIILVLIIQIAAAEDWSISIYDLENMSEITGEFSYLIYGAFILGFILLILSFLLYFLERRKKKENKEKVINQHPEGQKPKCVPDKHKIEVDQKYQKVEQTMCPITKIKLDDIPEDKLYVCPNMTCRTFYHYDAVKIIDKCVNCGRKITK